MVRDDNRIDRRERNGLKRTFKRQLQQHTDTSLHPAAKAAKRTRSARRPPSPSGPRPFTRRAAGPRPPLGSPEASLPAQMCSCLCRAVSTSSWPERHMLRFNRGGRHFYQKRLRLVENKEEKIPFAHSTGLLLFHHLIGLRLSICDGRMMWQPVFTCNFVFTSISS